jgi:hypothetical protein
MAKRGPLANNRALTQLKQRLLDDEADAREARMHELELDDAKAACEQRQVTADQEASEFEQIEYWMRTSRPNKYIGGRGGARPRLPYPQHRRDLDG